MGRSHIKICGVKTNQTAVSGYQLPRALLLIFFLAALISSCTIFQPRKPGIGSAIDWLSVEGWRDDNHAQVWPALLHNCTALNRKPAWQQICDAANGLATPDDNAVRIFFESWFTPYRLYGNDGKSEGLITGYYEPLLLASETPNSRYRYPIYGQPDSLLTINLGDLYPDLNNKRVRGMKIGQTIVPFYTRAEIESNRKLLSGYELLWFDDREAVFFLHIQGSGRAQLPSGDVVGVGYRDQNGHPYVSIGRELLRNSELKKDEISLFTIRKWLKDHPEKAENLLNQNPSYVFFVIRSDAKSGPLGSLNVPLTAERSIAIDRKLIPLGTPIWLDTTSPGYPEKKLRKLVIAQDTGGAIKGHLRADLFWGHGEEAERAAGNMKERGSMIVLRPKQQGST